MQVLLLVKAYPDGSFDMCPGFSRQGFKYRFEDAHGEPACLPACHMPGRLGRVCTHDIPHQVHCLVMPACGLPRLLLLLAAQAWMPG